MMITSGKKLTKSDNQMPLLDSSSMVVLTPSAEAKLVTSLNVESFGKMIVEKRVELACVLPKTDKLLSLLTVCSSLYSPTIRYTPLAG